MDAALWSSALPWLAGALVFLLAVSLFPRLFRLVARLIGRMGASFALLAALSPLGQLTGATLGVNLFNAATLALLGAPGLGLLLLTRWLLR